MPIILAIETSTEIASIALMVNGKVLTQEIAGAQTHSQTVLPNVKRILGEAGIAIGQCDAFAFGSGPGSFTGVRTACGIVQGLAFGTDRPVIPVITLEAMAYGFKELTGLEDVVTVLDARMGEVYWAQYRYADSLEILVQPTLSRPEQIAPVKAAYACGNGVKAYQDKINADIMNIGHEYVGLMPHAAQLVKLAELRLKAGETVRAHEAQPFYLRNKVAMTTAERAAHVNSITSA